MRAVAHLGRTPEEARRLHLVYKGVRPEFAGGECHEPYLIEFLRLGALDDGVGLLEADDRHRYALLANAGLPPVIPSTGGMLNARSNERRVGQRLRRAIGEQAPVIVPVLGLTHALGMARIIVRMGLRWGARLTESRQLRMGCFSAERLDGEWRPVASLRPKGWVEEAKFEIDVETLNQIRRTRDLAHARWWRGEVDRDGRGKDGRHPVRRAKLELVRRLTRLERWLARLTSETEGKRYMPAKAAAPANMAAIRKTERITVDRKRGLLTEVLEDLAVARCDPTPTRLAEGMRAKLHGPFRIEQLYRPSLISVWRPEADFFGKREEDSDEGASTRMRMNRRQIMRRTRTVRNQIELLSHARNHKLLNEWSGDGVA